MSKRIILGFFILCLSLASVSLAAQEAESPASKGSASSGLKITKWGPMDIKAGQVFNKQPSGAAALWVEAPGVSKTTVIVFHEVMLETTVIPGEGANALIPANLYDKPGTYDLYLKDTKTKKKSNVIKVVVKP